MASIVKRGKTYSLIYYEGDGNNRHQVWESGLSYSAAKARKASLEYEIAENTHIDRNDLTVSEFLYEFIEKYGESKWVASTYDGNVGLLENYVHPYLGDKKLRSIRTKTVDDYYHFLLLKAEPATNMGKPMRDKVSPSLIHDIHKVLRCAFNQAVKWEYKKLVDRLPKMEVMFKFPNLYPGTRTVIVLKQPKTDGSIRNVYTPDTVTQKLSVLRRMQDKLKQELGSDGYMDYGLMICQANGRPIMTEHLNKRFKDVLIAMGDPDVPVEDVVFHSIRHTSAGVKLRLSKGDLKAVQGDGGWNTPDMVTKRYAHILDEDRKNLAAEMEASFYRNGGAAAPVLPTPNPELVSPPASPLPDAASIASLFQNNPNLLMEVLQSVQLGQKA